VSAADAEPATSSRLKSWMPAASASGAAWTRSMVSAVFSKELQGFSAGIAPHTSFATSSLPKIVAFVKLLKKFSAKVCQFCFLSKVRLVDTFVVFSSQ
jgi:hypothetical protein